MGINKIVVTLTGGVVLRRNKYWDDDDLMLASWGTVSTKKLNGLKIIIIITIHITIIINKINAQYLYGYEKTKKKSFT